MISLKRLASIAGLAILVLVITGCLNNSENNTETDLANETTLSPKTTNAPIVTTTTFPVPISFSSCPVDSETEIPRAVVDALDPALGIKELIGEFTTYYEPGFPRVANIEQMAELTKGVIIESGEVFSINQYVGPRTIEKGFVSATALNAEQGLVADVGGGVSQFTTALFNAAFFAGLEFVQHRAHSYYFERYPYGREATVNYPTIDLQIHNITPSGILIWSRSNDFSTTVSLFGTCHFLEVREADQTLTPRNNCIEVETKRARTNLDGEVSLDSFIALYQNKIDMPCT